MTRQYRPPTSASDLATWTHHELRDEVERLRAALHWIADICPATAEHTLAHEMADAAIAALRKAP